MTKPVTLVAKDVARAALKAHARKRLSAQGPTPACAYRDGSGRPCAIGASLDARTARQFDAAEETINTDVRTLHNNGLIVCDNINALEALQRTHDLWAAQLPMERQETREADFLATARRIAGGGS